MVAFLPTPAGLVNEAFIETVPSPAYDSLSPAARRAWRRNAPESYLNVTRSPEDEEPGSNATRQDLISAGRKALEHLLEIGAFDTPTEHENAFFLYRLAAHGHAQIGIVGEVPVSEYDNGTIRIHEEIREARASLLADHFGHVGAASSPVALAYRQNPELQAIVARESAKSPTLDFGDSSGLTQTVWRLDDPNTVAEISSLMSGEPTYIIDGHHRAAAASTLANRTDSLSTMFVAMFPDDELQLLGFNRLVRNVGSDAIDRLLALPGTAPADGVPETSHGVAGICARNQWYTLQLDDGGPGLGQFDAVRFRDQLLGPIFGIDRSDSQALLNLSGDQPTEELMEMAERHDGVAIVLAPIALDAFMAAADDGIILPPKSTYFTPKVRSGIFLRQFARN